MAYGNVDKFRKPHSSEGGNGSTTNIYIGGSTNNGNLRVTNLTASNIDANRITANNIEASNAKFKYIMSEYGEIKRIEGNDLNYTNGHISNLDSTDIQTNSLKVKDTATIENIINNNLNSKNIVTDYLTVNKSAYFYELVIDKIRSVQGTQINTAANCIVDYVEAYDSNNDPVDVEAINVDHYRIYWKNKEENDDGSSRTITNDWLVYDQALCESFNVGTGVSYDVSNKYYWRLVTATDNGVPKYVNFNTHDVQNNEVTDYEIVFPDGFSYVNQTETEEFTDFTVESQITGEWDGTDTWTVGSTQYGLQITMPEYTGANGTFVFTTQSPTKLNVGVYYTDGTFGYFPGDEYKTNYNIATETDKMVEAFVIVCPKIEKWYACNWIELSNTDMDVTISGKSSIPSAGDNVCQLGYRYDQLPNPTQYDISRASAIIIAAYQTPDTGIVPPSYAQYQEIGRDSSYRWDLAHYRKSFFDATQCYIIGNFAVQAAGNTIPLNEYIQTQTEPQDATIIVESNNAVVDMCIMQTDSQGYIHDLNNLPGTDSPTTPPTRFMYISVYTDYSYTPTYVNCDLFGRTVKIMDINPNTGTPRLLPDGDIDPNTGTTPIGIYISNVTYGTNNKLCVTFGFNGSSQYIENGSSIQFYGQIVLTNVPDPSNPGQTTTKTINASQTITIATVQTAQGADAQAYLLYKDTEYAVVKQDKSLNILLRYAINHIVGTNATIMQPTSQKLRITRYKFNGDPINTTTLFDYDYHTTRGKSGNGYWEYTYNPPNYNWYTDTDKPIYLGVELVDSNNNNVLDNTLVEIILETSSLFTVEEGLTQSIQANTTLINDETNARQLQYTSISQTVSEINSTVTSHTTSINGMQTDISNIDQKANIIGLHVDSVEADVNGITTKLETTGIDIEQGKITLSAENTIIDGNLSIHNADEGLVIYDNATDTPKIAIQGDTLGTLSTGGPVPKVNDVYDTLGTVSSNTCTFNIVDLGQLAQNNKIAVNVNIYRRQVAGTIVGAPTYTYDLYRDNTLVQHLTGATSAIISDTTYYRFTTSQFTIPSDGNYTIVISITMQGGTDGDIFSAGVYVTRWLNTIQKIAKDGALFGTNGRNYSWFGSDKTELSWGATGSQGSSKIVLDGYGVNYFTRNGGYGEIGSQTTVAYVDSGSYYKASVYDGLICIFNGVQPASGNPFYLWLPDPMTCAGKIYYVKQVGTSTTIHVYAYNPNYDTDPSLPQYIAGAFLKEDCTGTSNSDYKNYVNLDGIAYTFISCYYKWLIFYNG